MSVHAEFNGRNWAKEILDNGGATLAFSAYRGRYDLDIAKHLTGFYVAAYARSAAEKMIPVAEFKNSDLGEFIGMYFAELVQPGFYLGAWIENGYVYLDITEHFDDELSAVIAGDFRDQIAIWDIAQSKSLYL